MIVFKFSFPAVVIYKIHDDVIKREHFPRYWPFVRGSHPGPVNSPHKSQWRGTWMFSFVCALNQRLSKQLWCWWFETPSCSLLRHCNEFKKWMTHATPPHLKYYSTPPPFQHFSLIFGNVNDKVTQCFSLENKCKKNKKLWKENNCHV